MDWRDLIAWQQVRTTVVTATGNPGNQLQLCKQDPTRIFLAISQQDGENPHTVFPGAWQAGQGSAGWAIGGARYWPNAVDVMPVVLTGTADPVTGDVNITGTITSNHESIAAVPATLEFWLDRHGMLAQSQWSTIEDGCPVVYYVVEVLQDRNPCDYTATGQPLSAGKVSTNGQKATPAAYTLQGGLFVPTDNPEVGSSGDVVLTPVGDQPEPAGADLQSNES
jgi:hypothetical protein